jgi:uncharacterized membrane protein
MLEKLQNPIYWLAILGGIKIILNANGVQIITDDQVNAIANGLSALVDVIAGAVALFSTKSKATEIKELKSMLTLKR